MAPPKKVYEKKKKEKGSGSQQKEVEKLTPVRKKIRVQSFVDQSDNVAGTIISVGNQSNVFDMPRTRSSTAATRTPPPILNPPREKIPTPTPPTDLPSAHIPSQLTPTPEQTPRTPIEPQSEATTETFRQLIEELNEEADNEEAGEPYNEFKFSSGRAQKGFEKYWSKRPVIVERGMELDHFRGEEFKLKQNFEARGWEKWVKFNGVAVVPIVQEFFSNVMSVKKEDKDCITTKVRGVYIEITPKDVRKFFGLKEEKQPQFPLELEDALDKDSLAKVLIENPNAEWGHKKKIAKNRLSSKFNSLHFLACSQLNPVFNTSELSYERGLLLYAIEKGLKVELGQLIWENMAEASKIKKGVSGLPFAGFITHFVCKKKKVTTELGEQVAKPVGPITASSRERSASHKKNKERTTTEEFMEKMYNKWDEVQVTLGEIKDDQFFIKKELQSQGKRIEAIEAKLELLFPSAAAGNSSVQSEDLPLDA